MNSVRTLLPSSGSSLAPSARPGAAPRPRAAVAVLATLALAGAAGAQVVATMPAGYTGTIGQGIVGAPFSARPFYRVQLCDETLRGTPLPHVIALNFRRDKANVRPQNVARTVTVDVAMGHGSLGAFDQEFAANFTIDRTQLATGRSVSLPNTFYPQNGPSQPEPWTARIPLDAPFAYSGQHALVVEIATQSNGEYVVESSAGTTGQLFQLATGNVTEYGCTVAGRAVPFTLRTTQYAHMRREMMRLEAEVSFGPGNAPVWLNISATDPLLGMPGLCGRLHALPDVQLPLGTTDAAGSRPATVVRFPWVGALTTTPLHMQAIALDPSQSGLPLALSDDSVALWPAAPAVGPAHASAHSQDPQATRASALAMGGAPICGLEQ